MEAIYSLIPVSAEKKLLKKAKVIRPDMKKIERHRDKIASQNKNGFVLGGIIGNGEPYYIFENDLNRHVVNVGTTGSGKTVTNFNFLLEALRKNKGLIYITGKHDQSDVDKFELFCKQYGREYKVFTLNGREKYNPFASGTATELTDKIIGMFDFSDDYYKTGATRFLQLLIRLMQELNIPVNAQNIIAYSGLDRFEIGDTTNQAEIKMDTPSFDSFEVTTHKSDLNAHRGDLSDLLGFSRGLIKSLIVAF